MFQGASAISLDAKGRLSVPARHRDALSASGSGCLTFTKHPHGCLMIFAQDEWEPFRARVAALPMSAQWWKRIFLGNASECELDASWRVLVPPELRAAAGIARRAMLLGMGNHLELWDADSYASREAEAIKGDPPPAFKNFAF